MSMCVMKSKCSHSNSKYPVYQRRTVENACAVASECALKEEMMWLRTRSSHRGPVSLPWSTSKGQRGHGRPPWRCTCNSILCVLALYLHWVFELCSVCTQWYLSSCIAILGFCCVFCDLLTTQSLILGAVALCIMVSCSTLLGIVCALSFPSQPRSSRVVGVGDPIWMHCALSLSSGQLFAGKKWGILWGKSSLSTVCPVYVSFVLL